MKKKPWKRLSQSDSEAVMRLVDEYQSSIKRIIVSVLKGQWPDAVDDILQDTYEEICRQLNLIEEAENRRAYVCKIAARLAIQAHRRLGRDLPLDEDVPAPEDLSFNLDTILPCSLSPSDKRLLKRVYEEQDNIVDIAKEFGKKDTALRQQLKRARDRVKKIIMKECRKLRREQFLLAAETLEDTAGLLLSEIAKPWSGDSSFSHFSIPLDGVERTLSVIHRQIRRMLTAGTRMELERVLDKTKLFCLHQPDMVYYTAEDETGGSMLCASATDLTAQLRQTLWQQDRPMILASGTLAVGSNFRRFKEETGLLAEGRVREHIAPSPFDYQRNCLLYLPPITPSQADSDYYDDLAEQIVKLLDAANGHALGLFTSYAAISAVRERLKQRDLPYPVLTLGRNGGHTMSEFMAHPGSVLLAAGAAWEGFDFPGDCVSLLILPRLPFPMPDAVKEQERMKHATLHDFLRAVVVPEMQIKLRQGFGRAIRTETDTCVVAILDERAGKNRRYFRDVLTALPEVPVTHSLKDVERFIRAVKPEGYFLEGAA